MNTTANKIFRVFLSYFLVFSVILLTVCTLLIAAGFFPQYRIDAHISESVAQFKDEGYYPTPIVSDDSYKLDNYTDSIILNESKYMNTREDFFSFLKNPMYSLYSDSHESAVTAFTELENASPQPTFNYVRYWMGFRIFTRPLLTILNYTEIRRLIMWVFFLLFSAVTVLLYSVTRNWLYPLGFAFSVALCNAFAIMVSLQFSCCFFIAFVAMLLVPYQSRLLRIFAKEGSNTFTLYFFAVGMLTQFFDFYTTPVLTYALPMITTVLYESHVKGNHDVKEQLLLAGRCLVSWLVAYGLMWLTKMLLTSLFTDVDAVGNAFGAFAKWMAPASDAKVHDYTLVQILIKCITMIADKLSFLLLGCVGLAWLVMLVKKQDKLNRLKYAAPYLFIGATPVIWLSVAAYPSLVHYWFQYRGLCAALFGTMVFMLESILPFKKVKQKNA